MRERERESESERERERERMGERKSTGERERTGEKRKRAREPSNRVRGSGDRARECVRDRDNKLGVKERDSEGHRLRQRVRTTTSERNQRK